MRRLDRSKLEIIFFLVFPISKIQNGVTPQARLFCALGGVLTSRTSPPCMVTSDYSTLLSGTIDLRKREKKISLFIPTEKAVETYSFFWPISMNLFIYTLKNVNPPFFQEVPTGSTRHLVARPLSGLWVMCKLQTTQFAVCCQQLYLPILDCNFFPNISINIISNPTCEDCRKPRALKISKIWVVDNERRVLRLSSWGLVFQNSSHGAVVKVLVVHTGDPGFDSRRRGGDIKLSPW